MCRGPLANCRSTTPKKATAFYKEYWEETSQPLFRFGHGLSYTSFEICDLKFEQQEVSIDQRVKFTVQVRDTGKVAGSEVVQVYFRDKVASVVRPEKLLIRFQKVFVQPGESKQLAFELSLQSDLSFSGIDMKRRTEPGEFELTVGNL